MTSNSVAAIVCIIGFILQIVAFVALWREWTGPFNYLLAAGYLLMAIFFLYLARYHFRQKTNA